MKRLFFFFMIIILLLNLLPAIILKLTEETEIKLHLNNAKTVRVYLHENKTVKVMPLEEYLVGVVAAEMPASFPLDALKAQAIAARTYTINKIQISGDLIDNPHPNADVCDNPMHCQAWISEAEQNKRWGIINAIYYRNKIKKAIADTQGLVLTYNGNLIDPVYHANCGGHTESASEVWNYDLPYLQGVEDKYDRDSPKYKTTVIIPLKIIDQALGTKISKLPSYRLWFSSPIKILDRTSGGRVKAVKIGDKTFSGIEIRTKLNLNSAKFDVKVNKNGAEFTVYGYGHGVGMCQWGAGGMAKAGKDYEEILKYYYRGIKIIKAY